MSARKMVYFFGGGSAEGNGSMKELLGGKGANLAEMASLGINVPAGFTITTEVCTAYYENNRQWPDGLEEQIWEAMGKVEKVMGKKFNDPENPLLVAIRSGARVSMPGMMDTVLNLGLNDNTAEGLIKLTDNPRFVYDSYRRFVQMYGDVVLDVPHEEFEKLIDAVKEAKGYQFDTEVTAEEWKQLVGEFKALIAEKTGKPFPEDAKEQLRGSINAVFGSWNNARAIRYRQINDIPGHWGTAVNVQAMAFGNIGDNSGTGVAFTRDPSTGENVFYGEYLMNAQGEDVVAGIRTPLPISTLKEQMPDVYAELESIYKKLELHYRDMQDIEFTIQEGKLFMLQTRNGKRTAHAAVRIAVDMANEGLIDKKTAVTRVEPAQLDQLLHPMLDPKEKVEPIASGLPASPGAAVGQIVFNAEDAEKWSEEGKDVILVRNETSPEDIGGMDAAKGILTARGGMTSHAAVVARAMGKCCVAGCSAAVVNDEEKYVMFGSVKLNEGDWITLNGTTGDVIAGKAKLVEPSLSGNFGTLMEWADEFRALKIRTNADTPHDAEVARGFGTEGIGLCRTEHMFFGEGRIKAVREMILATDKAGREKALAKLLPIQREDFYGIFKVMKGLPVTIRLLDPPLHEFVPHEEVNQAEMAKEMGVPVSVIKERVAALAEFNPMLGHRGCRLGVTYPEIYSMQAQAIFQAACQLAKEGIEVIPEVMIPLVGFVGEFEAMKKVVDDAASRTMEEYGVTIKYMVGTMIEVPRAALIADQIAEKAEFFSFGTNDLTQMTLGFSRDDAGTFLPAYVEQQIIEKDPFQTLDQVGVGQLVQKGVELGRQARPNLKLGICGEHGGDPASIRFCHNTGLDYVSCSPFRVPIARLAAAQANIEKPRN
ncbi:MAG TPA: pyruvate, phosphate dikinase [Firmicutes bacterium]|nr:pyruvate, phosphate dikinase [Bacillota bacterium]